MRRLRFLNAGESHGPKGTAIVEGMPAGVAIDIEAMQHDLARRQRSFGSGARMRIESDKARITSGLYAGKTTGGPIAIEIENRDYKNWQDKDIAPMTIARPGHADLTGALKYGYTDLRPSLERASARETATRVAAFSLCKQLLGHFGVQIAGYVRQIGSVHLNDESFKGDAETLHSRAKAALKNDLACPEPSRYEAFKAHVRDAAKNKDTLGGVLEIFATGLLPGLGSFMHFDRKLDAQIAGAMLGIQAMKGVEIGPAFENAARFGTQVHDAMYAQGESIIRKQNRAGGLEGGVTTGEPLVVRIAMKPISTTLTPLPSVELLNFEAAQTRYERSDIVAIARAVPIAEAMLAFVLANAFLEKTGGDSMKEIQETHRALLRSPKDKIFVDGKAWRFEYPTLRDEND